MQNKIIAQINDLNSAINSGNITHLQHVLDAVERNNIWLLKIVRVDVLIHNNGVMSTFSGVLQYENYAALARRYIEILQGELYDLQNNRAPLSSKAIRLIYGQFQNFQKNEILHISKKGKLSVSCILSVIGYAKKIISASGVRMNKNLSNGIDLALMALNTIDLALNNKEQDKPLNKALHLVNDALSTAYSVTCDNEQHGRYVEVSSLTIDLTIDFLVKE